VRAPACVARVWARLCAAAVSLCVRVRMVSHGSAACTCAPGRQTAAAAARFGPVCAQRRRRWRQRRSGRRARLLWLSRRRACRLCSVVAEMCVGVRGASCMSRMLERVRDAKLVCTHAFLHNVSQYSTVQFARAVSPHRAPPQRKRTRTRTCKPDSGTTTVTLWQPLQSWGACNNALNEACSASRSSHDPTSADAAGSHHAKA
jgi:hypothetical protein